MSQNRPHPHVVEEPVFRLIAELEVRKALRIQYSFSIVTIARQLPHGTPAAQALWDANSVVGPVSRVIRASDVIGLVSNAAAVRVLLVGAYIDEVGGVIERVRAEISPDLTLRFGVACFPATDTTAGELLNRADLEAGLTSG